MTIETINLFGRNDVKVYSKRPKNIASILDSHIVEKKDKLAVVTEDKTLTYGELSEQTDRMAAYLQKECLVRKGDRIATVIGNRYQFPLIAIACAKIGAIMVPINVKLSEPEMEYIILHSDIKVLLYEESYEEKIVQLRQLNEDTIPTFTYNVDNEEVISNMVNYKGELESVEVDELDGAYLLYTSGTTGRPKGALLTHINVIHSVMNYQQIFQTHENLKTLIAVPMFHVTGLVAQIMHVFYIGGTVYSMEKYKNQTYIELILKHKINFLFNVPTIFIMMSTDESFLNNNFDFVEKVAYGGSPIYKQTYELLRKSFPNAELHNAYGATETTSPATLMPVSYPDSKVASVGKPVPTADIKIVDEFGNECETNEIGEIYIKGPMVVKEYWRNPDANEHGFLDGYWKSGDIGFIDEDGFVYVKDRLKDMINRGGEKIFSIEVEDVLKSHPQIKEAAVVGVPDEVFGERVKAILVTDGINHSNIDVIKEFCKQKLAAYKVPEIYEFLNELPRNASGKILKGSLK